MLSPYSIAHTVISSRCSPELFHSSPVSQPSFGSWSTIDCYEQRSPLARETDFTQRTNNIHKPNQQIAHMNAPDVLATPGEREETIPHFSVTPFRTILVRNFTRPCLTI